MLKGQKTLDGLDIALADYRKTNSNFSTTLISTFMKLLWKSIQLFHILKIQFPLLMADPDKSDIRQVRP